MRGRERVKTNISDFPKEEKFEVHSKEKEERKMVEQLCHHHQHQHCCRAWEVATDIS